MTEFKRGQEVWAKFKVKNPVIDRDGEIRIVNESGWKTWAKPEEIMTAMPEKPVIPQFVADWIENCKIKGYPMFHALSISYGKTAKWLAIDGNDIVFAMAYGYGYTVEKPKLYTVEIPNAYHGSLGYSPMFDNLSFYNKQDATEIRFELTEAEIRKDFEWAWQAGFAKEVE